MKKKIVVAAAISLPLFTLANASLTSFSGGYLGADVGAAWNDTSYSTNPGCQESSVNAVFCNSAPEASAVNGTAVANSGTGSFDSAGSLINIHGGYNWQKGRAIFGAEADFGNLGLSDYKSASGTFPFAFAGTEYTVTDSISTSWFSTLRARLGFAFKPRLLFYTTGGAAITDYQISSGYNDNAVGGGLPGGSGSSNDTATRVGWTVGAGGEWLLTNNCSIKAEYLYMDFGSVNLAVPLSNTPTYTQTINVNYGLAVNLVRLGLNYRF